MTRETRTRSLIARLLAAHAVLFLLQASVFTAPALHAALRFDPARGLDAPWSVVTWPLVHEGLGHLVLALALLAVVGPRVAAALGSRGFLLYYLYTVVGAALVALGLGVLAPMPALSGALAPALAVALGYAWLADDEEVSLAPLAGRFRIRTLVGLGIFGLAGFGLATGRPWLAVTQFGGALAGALFLRLRTGSGPRSAPTPLPIRQVVMTRVAPRAESVPREPAVAPPGSARGAERDEMPPLEQLVDRVLDKISAEGLESLTSEERLLLDRYAERKRDQPEP